jgi:bifunctional non-homologous end joining protein LigD
MPGKPSVTTRAAPTGKVQRGATRGAKRESGPTARDVLEVYKQKRNFAKTPEPAEGGESGKGVLQFVVQKHWASRLHYDFRLELGGAMKSWAVPKGPSFDPKEKRMAVQVEDHPIAYNQFEGQIPAGQYGAGKVIIWDKGTWTPLGDAEKDYRDGKLKFELHGHKLQGRWTLVRMHGKESDKQPPWLLIKEHDAFERPAAEFSVVDEMPDSVAAAPPVRAAREAAASKGTAANGVKAALPETLSPQLATLVDQPPVDLADWLFELKFDGYRLLARVHGKRVQLFTRNGHDWTSKMPELAEAIQELPLKSGWLDGEILVMDNGIPNFQALQNAFDGGRTAGIVYYVFDLPFLNGRDLRSEALQARREALRSMLAGHQSDKVLFSESFEANPRDLVASACQIGFEGVIGKRKDAVYTSRRSPDWIKLKCSYRQEFVIGGYTDPKNSRTGLGSLLLGVHDDKGDLQYAGNVGTGFSEESLSQLKSQLEKLHTDRCPFANPRDIDKKSHWVKPRLLAEVSFAEWTGTHRVRHSVFHGLRADKPPSAIVREEPRHMAATKTSKPAAARVAADKLSSAKPISLGKLRVTHPDRVIDAKSGVTKLDLVRYYATVAPLMMEHLKGRPVSLVRAPAGIEGEQFFQKHHEGPTMPGVSQLPASLDPGHPPLLEVVSQQGLLSAAQMNVVEFHTWNGKKDRIERPDRMTFDIDPGEGVAWAQIQEAALLVRSLLDELALPAFLKTSGGKGLHVVVPIKRLHDWDTVKGFSEAVVRHLAQTIPERFVAKSGPRNRVGKIFVDYLRNGRGATTACAWTARARPGMGISVPVRWSELERLESGAHWTVETVDARLRIGNQAWEGYSAAAKSLTAAIKALGA